MPNTQSRLKHFFRAAIYLTVVLSSFSLGQYLIYAIVTDWTFAPGTIGDYDCSDNADCSLSTVVELSTSASGPEYPAADAEGVARLKKLATFTDTTLSDFNASGASDYFTQGVSDPPGPSQQTEVVSGNLQLKRYGAAAFSGFTEQPFTGYEPSLVALYHLSDANDATSPQENGTATNVTFSAGKFANGAMGFDGTNGGSRIDFNDDGDFELTNDELTISAWVRLSSAGTAARDIVTKWKTRVDGTCTSASNDRAYRFYMNASEQLVFESSATGSNTIVTNTCTSCTLTAGAWTHVAVTHTTANAVAFYVNGKRITTATGGNIFTGSTADFRIGANQAWNNASGNANGCTTNVWLGDIDEVAFFNRALSAEEIMDYYGNHARMAALYHFDNNANDSSGFVMNGTPTSITYNSSTQKLGTHAAIFGGGSVINSPTDELFNVDDTLTLQAWIKPTGTAGTQYLFSSTAAGTIEKYGLRLNGDKLEARSDTTTPTSLAGKTAITGDSNTWTHVAAVWDYNPGITSGVLKLFVNGILDSQTTFTGTITAGSTALRMGQDSAAANQYQGDMDEAAIFRRARTNEEILRDAAGYPRKGTYRSGSKNAVSDRPWDNLLWTEPIRYGDGASTSDSYIQHLYRLNEVSGAGSLADAKGGTTGCGGASCALTPNGGNIGMEALLFNPDSPSGDVPRARYYNSASDYATSDPNNIPSYAHYTVEAYVRFGVADNSAVDNILSINNNPKIWRTTSETISVQTADGTITSTSAIKDTRWHHIAVTSTGDTLTLYIDGVQEATSGSFGVASSAAPLWLADDGTGSGAFVGAIEEVAIYGHASDVNAALSQATLQTHYRQMKTQIKHLSRSCNASTCAGINFVGYDNVSNGIDPASAAGMVGLWLFDENSWGGTVNEVADSENNGSDYDGTAIGPNTDQDALFSGRSGSFNGADDAVYIADAAGLQIAQPLSISTWIKLDEEATEGASDSATIIAKQCVNACNGGAAKASYALEITKDQKLRLRIGHAGGEITFDSDNAGDVPVGEWAHIVATYDTSGNCRFYINNVDRSPASANNQTIAFDAGPLVIGNDASGARSGFRGKMDHLALYSTLLSSGDAQTLFNNGNPYTYVSRAVLQDPGPANEQYFQYKTIFTTDGSETPQLNDITVKNTVFDTSNPYIEATTANKKDYTTFGSFGITYGPSTPYSGNVRFIFKNGAAGQWKWWDAGAAGVTTNCGNNKWANSDGSYAQATPPSELVAHAMECLDDAEVLGPNGSLYWRMFLNSPTGAEGIEVDNVSVTDITSSVTLTAPEGQTLTVGDPLDVTWDFNTISTVVLEYTTDGIDFFPFTPPGAAGTPADTDGGSGCVDPGANAGCYRVTVPDTISSSFQVRVSDKDAVASPDLGANNTVRGRMTITNPPTLTADTDYTITWTAYGSTGTMAGNNTQIDFDPDTGGGFGGGDVINITNVAVNGDNGACSAGAPSNGAYPGCWIYHLPASAVTNGATARFRVCDPSGCSDSQYTAQTSSFTVTGTITPVLSPSLSGTAWKVETGTNMAGSAIELDWTYKGSIGGLRLYFDKTGNFSGSERTIRGAGSELNLTGDNGTGCSVPSGGGCYILSGGEQPNANELTHGATAAKFRLQAAGTNPVINSDTTGFEVRGWYELTSPAATATWRVGELRTIGWETHGNTIGGTTGNVFIQYNNDSGNGTWTTLAGIAGTGLADGDGTHSFDWNTVQYVSCTSPERGCNKVRLRVVDKDTTTLFDQPGNAGSEFDMEILPTLTLTNPENTALEMESTYSSPGISWTIGGLLGGNVSVYYSTNNFGAEGTQGEPDGTANCTVATGEGSACVVVNGVLSSASGQTWEIPTTASVNTKLRIISALDSDISDDTNTANRIHAKFNVPVPAPTLEAGENATITWTMTAGTVASVPNVKIVYSTNNFGSSTTIAGTTGNDGSHPWAVPTSGLIHDNVKIRVSDATDTIVPPDSASDSPAFKVKSRMRLISPSGSTAVKIGQPIDLQWGYKGSLSEVDLKLCLDYPTCSSVQDIALNQTSGGGAGCTVPTTELQAGETGGCYRWADATTGGVGDYRGLTNRIQLVDSDTGCTPAQNCGTRPTSNSDMTLMASDLKIMENITVTQPNTAVKWDAATSNTVQFSVRGSGQNTVDIQFSSDGGSNYTGTVLNNKVLSPAPDGTLRNYSQNWTTPSAVSTSTVKYRVRVKDDDDAYTNTGVCSSSNDTCDASDVNFDVVARFDIAAPANGNTWRIGDTKNITWTTAGNVSTVDIQYFTSGVGSWQDVVLDESNDGIYEWPIQNVAGIIANDAVIRIVDSDTGHILRTTPSQSAGAFNIVPAFTLVQPPQAGATWRATQTRNVQWRVIGLATNASIKLWYSTDGSGWTEIDDLTSKVAGQNSGCTLPADGTGTEGCYNWTIPAGAISNTAYLKITDGDAGHPASDADGTNGISSQYVIGAAQSISISVPAGPFTVNGTADVAWTASGPFVTAGGVKIEYSTGAGHTTLVANADPDAATGGCALGGNTGCYRVTVPDAVSSTFTFRVSDKDDGDILSSSTNRTVNGTMAIDNPPASMIVDDVVTITWTATGSTGAMAGANTTIEYDKDGLFDGDKISITTTAANGVNVTGEGTCTPAGTDSAPVYYGCYKWRIPPGTISDGVQAKFQVIDGGFSHQSAARTVTGAIAISAPNASDVWKAETIYKMDGSTNLDVVWSFKGNTTELGTGVLWFDKAGTFSGGERQIATGVNLETANGTGCTDPGAGSGCYRIQVADVATANELTHGAAAGKFRLVNATPNPDVAGLSAGFEVRGWYRITGPAATETWLYGAAKTITWETHGNNIGGTGGAAGTGKILIQYNNNSGVGSWTNLAGVAGTGIADADGDANSFNYTTQYIGCYNPERGCDKVRLRIVDYDTSGTTATYTDQPGNAGSEFDLTLLPTLSGLTPNGAVLQVGSSPAVAWTVGGSLGSTVDVFYSTNDDFTSACNSANGNGKCTVCLDVTASDGTCSSNWNIPDITYSNNVKLKVVSDLNAAIEFTQTSASRIHGKFSLTEPGGSAGQSYNSEEAVTANIAWTQLAGTTTSVPNVKLQYSHNNFGSSTTIVASTQNDGSFNGVGTNDSGPWIIPEALIHDTVKVRVLDVNDTATPPDSRGDSVNNFKTKTKMRVIYPDATGLVFKIGVPVDITWGYKGTLSTVDIKLCTGADSSTCASPVTIANDASSGATGGCTAPSGGTLQSGETGGCYRWTDATTGGVSNHRGLARIQILDSDADTVPTGGTRPASEDKSGNDFKIVPNIIMLSPNTAVKWDAATANNIQFQVQGTGMNTVDIFYSDDSGASYGGTVQSGFTLDTPNAPLAGSLTTYTKNWTTPPVISDTTTDPITKYRVKVKDPDTANFDEAEIISATDFDIVAKFTHTQPTAAANWQVGSNQTISWTTKGTVNNVKLSFRTGLTSYATIIQNGSEGGAPAPTATNGAGVVANTGSFVWQVPATAGIIDTAARIRIEDADTGHVLRTSLDVSSNFDILPKFTFLNPGSAAGEQYLAGNANPKINFQWRTKGPVSNVTIQYSINGGGWTTIQDESSVNIDTVPNGQNGSCTLPSDVAGETEACYEWKAHANSIGTNVKFRVIDADGGHPDSTQITGNGESTNGVTINKAFYLLQPNGSESLLQNVNYDIQWRAYGSFTAGAIDLHYSNTSDFTAGVIAVMTGGNNDANASGCSQPSVDSGGAAGCYRWPVNEGTQAGLYMRVRENVAQGPNDISDSAWEIAGKLSLQAPNGVSPSFFKVGNSVTVQWKNNDAAGPRETTVDLEYSTNGFSGACNTATGAGSCPVCNVATSGSACPGPNQAENLDNLDTSALYNAAGCGGTGCWEYTWVIPDNISDVAAVRVIKHDDALVEDRSNNNFKFVGVISLSTLASADAVFRMKDSNAPTANPVTISWTRTGSAQGSLFDNFSIDYSTDANFSTSVTVDSDVTLAEAGCSGAATSCSYTWYPDISPFDHSANITDSAVYYLRVIDPQQTDGKAVSVKKFQLAGSMNLGLLTGGNEIYPIGTNKTVSWTRGGNEKASYFDNFIIQFDDDSAFGSPVQIANLSFADAGCSGADTTCSYAWPLSNAAAWSTYMVTTPTYYLRVYDSESHASDVTKTHVTSGANRFELRGDIAILNPLMAGNQIFKMGSPVTIDWTRYGDEKAGVFDSFALQFSSTGAWAGEEVTITTLDFSNGAGGAKCTGADTACTYTWTPGTSGPDYSTYISAAADYNLRVIETDNPDSVKVATDKFELRGDITLDALPGSQVYQIGTSPVFTWSKVGNSQNPNFNNFTLQFSSTGAWAGEEVAIATVDFSTAGCGSDDTCSYTWSVDSATYSTHISGTKTYYLRVLDTTNPDTAYSSNSHSSNKQFKIAGRIALDPLPVQGGNPAQELYFVGTPVTFTWARDGALKATYFDNFQVQYSTSSTFSTVANASPVLTFTDAQCNADLNCEYDWTPGDSDVIVPAKDYYLRVVDPDDTDTASTSVGFANPKFELAGDVDLTVLTGANATYTVGSTVPITWTKKGSANGSVFDDVNLAYSTDPAFGTSTSVASGVVINGVGTVCDGSGNCSRDWAIPTSAVLSNDFVYYLRVRDPANTDSVSISTFRFKLKGGFSALTPTVSDEWIVGTDQTFGWTTNGAMSNVRISYSTDNFTNQRFMQVSGGKLVSTVVTDFGSAANVTNAPNGNSSYTITVPDAIHLNNFKLRVYDANDQNIFQDSAGFKVHGKFTTTAPGGTVGEIKTATGTVPVTWTVAGTVTKAKFEYSTDNGSNWNPITASQSGSVLNDNGISTDSTLINTTRTFNWTIPAVKSGNLFQALVRVSAGNTDNTPDTDTSGSSVNGFKIVAKVSVASPNGEQNPLWKVNESDKVITWTTSPANLGGSNQVTLWYSTNNGGAWTQIGAATANDGTEPWNPIPDAVTDQALIRVMDSADSDGKDQSDANFSIAGNLTLTTLLGNDETFVYAPTPAALAVTTPIQWTSAGTAMNRVLLQYSNDNFATDVRAIATITNNAVGVNTYNWQVPDAVGSNWRVRVINDTANTPAVESRSTSNFKILVRYAFTSHNAAADKCLLGLSCTITWVKAGSSTDATLEYSLNGTSGPWTVLHTGFGSIPDGGSYNWSVPSNLSPGTTTRYRATDAQVGHPVPSTGALEVTDVNSKVVAGFTSANIKARINGSGASFITVGGQTWGVGQTIDVQYTYSGIVGSIKAYYSLDDFATPVDITSSISSAATNGDGTGAFSYQFTDLLAASANTTNVKFLITDATVPDLVGNTTNGVTGGFKVKGVLAVTNPNAGTERWTVGQNATVAWTSTGSVSNVRIIYDDNSFFLSPSTIIASTASTPNVGGSYQFTVNTTNLPDLDTAPLYYKTIYVRVQDADGEGVSGSPIHGASQDDSNLAHKIIGQIVVTDGTASPQTGAKWPIGSPQTITWTTYGKVPSVDIYYDDDGLFNGNEVKINGSAVVNNQGTNVTGAQTSYNWTNMALTLPLTNTYEIRVVDAGDNTTPESPSYKVTGDSGAFKIHGTVDTTVLTSPNGVLKHKASDTATITWNTVGNNLNNVDIEYRDGTGTYLAGAWQTIALNHDNTGLNRGTRSWTIPETFNSSDVEVRVKPADGTTDGQDILDTRKFMPKITVTDPETTDALLIGTSFDIKWDIRGVISNLGIRYRTDGSNSTDYSAFSGSPYEIYTSGTPLVINGTTVTKTGANAKIAWTVADTPSANQARIMIYDPADPSDVYGVSDNNASDFSIIGFFVVDNYVYNAQTLGAGAEFEVYDAANNTSAVTINWHGGGTIPDAIIEYSDTYNGTDPATFDAGAKCLDGTLPANNVGGVCPVVANWAGSSGNTNFIWQVPDDISATKPYFLRIKDPNDSTVFDIFPDGAGNGFKIKSKFNMTKPDASYELFVGNVTHQLEWKHSGTVANVVLEYSADGDWDHEDDNSDGVLNAGEDNDADGFLDVIGCVDGGTYPNCNSRANTNATNGTNTLNWQVPDNDRIVPWKCVNGSFYPDPDPNDLNHPCKIQTAKMRVRDAGDTVVLDDSSTFTARYVAKKWFVRNSVTGAELDSITMFENSIHKIRAFSGQNVPGLVSPFILWNPAGTNYTVAFQKTGFTDIYDSGQSSVLVDAVNAVTKVTATGTELVVNAPERHEMVDEFEQQFLSDIVAHQDIINQKCDYTKSSDTLTCSVWYSRDGLNVVTSAQAEFRLFKASDNSQLGGVPNTVSNTQNPSGSGVFTFSFPNSGLAVDTVYNLRSKLRLASGSDLEGFATYSVTAESEAQTTSDNVATITPIITNNIDAKLSTEFADVKSKIDAARTSIETTVTDTKDELVTKMDEQTTLISDAIEDFTDKADDAIFRMQDEITKGAIRLIVPGTTKVGSTETIRVATNPGVTPSLDFLCPNGAAIMQGVALVETTTPGIYATDITFGTNQFRCAVAKAVTVIATATIASTDPGDPSFIVTAVSSIALTTTDLDTIQGLAAAGLNAEKAAKDAKDAINKVAKALAGDGSITASLENLNAKVDRLPALMSKGDTGMNQMKLALEEIAAKLNGFMGDEGLDMRQLLKDEIGEGMKGVRNKVEQTKVATEVIKQIVERKIGKSDEPIIQTFYEIG